MVPATFVYLDALPLTPNGKLDRVGLPPPSDARPLLNEAFLAPRSGVERKLTKLCEQVLGIRPIGVKDNLFDLGMDSLTMLRLTARIQSDFARHLPPAALFSSPTIAHLAEMLRSTEDRREWRSLFPVHEEGSKLPFFWIHGDASTVFLSRFLGPDQPLYGLEHQGQDGRPAKYQDVDSIVAYYLRQIRTVQSRGPYVLGGYSFGGIVALELAQQLTRLGEHVMLLALLDPPSLTRDSRSQRASSPDPQTLRSSISFRGVARHRQRVVGLPLSEQAAYIWARAVQWVGQILKIQTTAERSKTVVYKCCFMLDRPVPVFARSRYILDVYKRAREGWEPKPYGGRTILFKGAARRYESVGDWEQLLTGDLQVHVVNATHTELRENPHVGLWAEQLKAALDDCYSDPGVALHFASESDRSFV
jgi:thioesterase domain-containing protein/aryl carrier-like protein